MLVPTIRLVLTVVLGLLVASPLLAQPTVGHVSHVEGAVTRLHRFASAPARPTSGELRRDLAGAAVGREGGPGAARIGLVLLAGDQVHVAMGRAEITLTDGSALQLDAHTRVALHAVDRFQVLEGRVFVRSSGAGPLIAEAAGRRVHLAPGVVAEVTTTSSDLLVRVVDGDARIESSWGSEAVAATQSAFVSGPTRRPFVGPWVPPRHDGFHQWAGGRMVVPVPPPTFLPYAHPTYRQQEYEGVLRRHRFERWRNGSVTRGDRPTQTERRGDDRRAEAERRGGDRRAEAEHRGSHRQGDERGGEQTRRNNRRERDGDTRLRSEASTFAKATADKSARQAAQREPPRPTATPPAATPRAAARGVVVRPR